MSLALERVVPVTVNDPRIIQQERVFPVLKGAEQVLYKQWGTTSVSKSSMTFQCPPPSAQLYVDRKVHIKVPCRIKLTSSSTFVDAKYLLQPGGFALRSFPIQKALETIQMTINNQAMSINIGDILSALEHYNMSAQLKAIDYSKCATYPASFCQAFIDLTANSARNPLGYHESAQACNITKNQMFTVEANTVTSATSLPGDGVVIDFVSTEPLFLSPLFFGCAALNDSAFYGVNSMSFTFNFSGSPGNRMVAINSANDSLGAVTSAQDAANRLAVTVTSDIGISSTDIAALGGAWSYGEDTAPQLLFQYLTPQLVDRGGASNKVLNYPYYNIERYPTAHAAGAVLAAGVVGADVNINSTNVQLNSIPTKLYIFCRENNQALNKNPFAPDSFYRLKSLNLQWGNRSGLLASASREQLYDISCRAGCTMSWADWSGDAIQWGSDAAGAALGNKAGGTIRGAGTVMAIDPIDLGLDSIDAPGKLDQITLQVNAVFNNISLVSNAVTMYVIAVSAGVFTLYNGQASSLIGVLNSNDILNSHQQSGSKMLNYFDAKQIYGGGFLSDLKSDLRAMKKGKKNEGGSNGAGASGGQRVSRVSLRDRLS